MEKEGFMREARGFSHIANELEREGKGKGKKHL